MARRNLAKAASSMPKVRRQSRDYLTSPGGAVDPPTHSRCRGLSPRRSYECQNFLSAGDDANEFDAIAFRQRALRPLLSM